MPAFVLEHGFVDHLIRTAMQRGVPPLDAYRMATLNPATYFGKDAELGGIAPGRYADICVLRDLGDPRPEIVVARGRLAARDGRTLVDIPEPPWRRVFATPAARLVERWRARAEDFRLPDRPTLPVAARHERELVRHLAERGYAFHDPLFTLLFLSADFLPAARLTPLGVWDVKAARVLLPSRRRGSAR